MFYLASHYMLVGLWNIGEHITSLQSHGHTMAVTAKDTTRVNVEYA